MGGTELKTDSSQRWVMYVKDTYGNGRIFLTTEKNDYTGDRVPDVPDDIRTMMESMGGIIDIDEYR